MCTLSRTKVLKKKVENNKTHRSQMRTVISNGKYLLKSVIDHGNKYMSTKTPCRRMWASILGSIFCMTVSKKKVFVSKKIINNNCFKKIIGFQKKSLIFFQKNDCSYLRKTAQTSLNCGHCSFCTIATKTTRPRPWYWPTPQMLGRCLENNNNKKKQGQKKIMVDFHGRFKWSI